MVPTVNRVAKRMMLTSACSPVSTGNSLQHSGGFTLLEILLVLVLIGIASMVVIPNLGGLEVRSFGARVREATALLNYARRIAVVSGQPATASFVVGTESGSSARPDAVPAEAGRWQGEGLALRFRDSTHQESEVDERLDVVFYPEGGSTGGTLRLQLEDRVAEIAVDPITGRVNAEYLEAR